MMRYLRPLAMTGGDAPADALTLAGGWCWFDRVAIHQRGEPVEMAHVSDLPPDALAPLTTPRASIAGLRMDRPQIMGILNVTPDSFSDGGQFNAPDAAIARAVQMHADGAAIIDIGGESTRPGAKEVDITAEIARTAPVIRAIRNGSAVPVSIDTRKAPVAAQALDAGANLINDVAAMTFDADIAQLAATSDAPICLMHAQGDPETMQADPRYDDVLLDVYDFLAARIAVAETAGIRRDRIIVDPGIGFGKTIAHNLTLLRGLSLFHSLGCPILLGASRKRFIGALGGGENAQDRVAGSVAVALQGLRQGVQITRVHDTFATKQAFDLEMAINGAGR